jgi:hypothetical protein
MVAIQIQLRDYLLYDCVIGDTLVKLDHLTILFLAVEQLKVQMRLRKLSRGHID